MSKIDQNPQPFQHELDLYHEFIRTHPKSRLEFRGQPVEYIACGAGSCTIFIPPHISRLFPAELGYRQILEFEKKYRVIAPSLIESDSLDEIAASLLRVLEKEGAGPVILFGQSGSGITAQSFFRRYFQHVAGMILINTVAPGHRVPGSFLLTLLNLLPAALLKFLIKRKLAKLVDEPGVPAETMLRVQMSQAILSESFTARFSKRQLLRDLRNVIEFSTETVVPRETFAAWKGRILIVTSEDDPGHDDSLLLSEKLPHASLLVLEKGYGHLAPAVKSREVQLAVDRFIDELCH